MSNPHRKPLPPLQESFGCAPIYCDGLARIERHGPCCHLIFAVQQRTVYDQKLERQVAARLIVPADSLHEIAQMLLRGETGPEWTVEPDPDFAPPTLN